MLDPNQGRYGTATCIVDWTLCLALLLVLVVLVGTVRLDRQGFIHWKPLAAGAISRVCQVFSQCLSLRRIMTGIMVDILWLLHCEVSNRYDYQKLIIYSLVRGFELKR